MGGIPMFSGVRTVSPQRLLQVYVHLDTHHLASVGQVDLPLSVSLLRV